jgi:DNA segregation ATPase FtsK/SpoIIIE, S-DNA-T family
VLVTIAPIVASIALFLLTRSSFALIFAALGPIIALASAADSWLQRRRALRRESARFEADARSTIDRLERVHDAERAELLRAWPSIDLLASELGRSATRWRSTLSDELTLRVGTTTLASNVRYAATDAADPASPGVAERIEQLRERAARLTEAPMALDLSGGVGIAGPRALALAAARAIVLQLAHAITPATTVIEVPAGGEWSWAHCLPGALQVAPPDSVRFVEGNRSLLVAVVPDGAPLPRGTRLPVTLAGDATAHAASESAPLEFDPDFVGEETAAAIAAALALLAVREAVRFAQPSVLAETVELASLPRSSVGGLSALVGAYEDGNFPLDLAADGPHAIVGGTTGSGKSELLVTWVLGMAATRGPAQVSFLFVDFKGGAAFETLRRLPHCVGVITDLDAEESYRAISSLSAELRARERSLAARGLRSIDESYGHPPFPRLVVVVDEYAALLEAHDGLHAVMADIAARGRSLGLHLILCTQRPAGVVRDSILANCALRVSLRVHSAADSVALLGTDAAAHLPARPPGRALASLAGAPPTTFQVALARESDIDLVVERWAEAPRPRPPWRPPLPEQVAFDAARLDGVAADIPFALVDLPGEQRRAVARYRPSEHGSLLVVGAGGSGKSALLATLAAVPSLLVVERIGSDLPRLWDAFSAEPTGRRVLLVDDLDAVIAACPDDYEGPLLDLLACALREGPARGTFAVITAQRISGGMYAIASLCGSTVMLRMPNRQEHVLASGDPAEFLGAGAPGAGHWRGNRVQVFDTAVAPIVTSRLTASMIDPSTATVVVVSTRPDACATFVRRLAPERRVTVLEPGFGAPFPTEPHVSVGDVPDILIADPDVWQSQWSLFGSLRRSSQLVFDGCTVAEFRALTRSRSLPPPFPRGERALWLLEPDGTLTRARWRDPGDA